MRVNVTYLQKTKWKGKKAKELTNDYKLYYERKDNVRNEVSCRQ